MTGISQNSQQAPSPGSRSAGVRALTLSLATAGGVGCAPVAPGTFGSALAVLLYFPLAALGPLGYGLAALALLAAGIPAAGAAERIYGRSDDGRIAIDEVVGQLLTLSPLLFAPPLARTPLFALLVTGFFAFRLFDIWKPGPVRLLERRLTGGWGVMLDDVAAGAFAALVLLLLRFGLRAAGLSV
jgi:phosphatidylglycerophosphatase A